MDLKDALAPLKMNSKKIIFIPVNNNKTSTAVGGSHWLLFHCNSLIFRALLVYIREQNVFHFYDSYDFLNFEAGKRIANKIWKLLEAPIERM